LKVGSRERKGRLTLKKSRFLRSGNDRSAAPTHAVFVKGQSLLQSQLSLDLTAGIGRMSWEHHVDTSTSERIGISFFSE
jgi:hypothetical protein